MRKFIKWTIRVITIIILLILICWIIFAQVGMKFRRSDADAKLEFSKENVQLLTSTQSVNGRQIHYVATGKDSLPTIIFIHGSPGSWDAFAEYLKDKELLEKFRMISIDRPGFGYSDFGESENLSTQSKLLSPLIESLLNGKPTYLVGHSLGGPMIIKLAADNPGFFNGLVILAGSMDPDLEEKESWRPILNAFPLRYLAPGAMRPSNKELWYLKKDLVDLKEDFGLIKCPVIIVHGNKDNMVPFANVDYTKKMLVNAANIQVKILEGSNHFIPWTRFNDIKQILLNLDSH
ncbi:MAG: alpha/beta hydrolase [Bacteroidetes bacterium]|nr:MAG: alpha/beta hydrolase [Bacteroidota bacterium]